MLRITSKDVIDELFYIIVLPAIINKKVETLFIFENQNDLEAKQISFPVAIAVLVWLLDRM